MYREFQKINEKFSENNRAFQACRSNKKVIESFRAFLNYSEGLIWIGLAKMSLTY